MSKTFDNYHETFDNCHETFDKCHETFDKCFGASGKDETKMRRFEKPFVSE